MYHFCSLFNKFLECPCILITKFNQKLRSSLTSPHRSKLHRTSRYLLHTKRCGLYTKELCHNRPPPTWSSSSSSPIQCSQFSLFRQCQTSISTTKGTEVTTVDSREFYCVFSVPETSHYPTLMPTPAATPVNF